MNLALTCTCGEDLHIGSTVRMEAATLAPGCGGGADVTGTVTDVREVPVHPAREDVYPHLAGQPARVAYAMVVTSEQGYPLPARGDAEAFYSSTQGVAATGCGDTVPEVPVPPSSWAPRMPHSAQS